MTFATGTPEITGTRALHVAAMLALALVCSCQRSPPPAQPVPAAPAAAAPSGGPAQPPNAPPAAVAPSGGEPASSGLLTPGAAAPERLPPAPARAAAGAPVAGAPAAGQEKAGGAEPAAARQAAAPPPVRATPRPPVRPSVPAGVKVEVASPTEVTVEWRPSGEEAPAAGYEVRGGEEVLRTTATRVRVAHLVPGSRYCFAVWAIGAGDLRSDGSEPVCLETPRDVTPPAAPAGLVAKARGGEVLLRWSATTDDVGVAGYELLRDGKVVASVPALEASETGLRSAEHCYTVRAYDAAGNRSSPSAPACATPPDVTPPSTPAKVTVSATGEGEMAIAWAPSVDDVAVAGYDVRREDTPVARVTEPAAREGGLRVATRYCYRVIAFDAAGNRSSASEAACAVTPDLTAPTSPAWLAAGAAGEGRVLLSWAPATDNVAVTGYEVWRDGKVLTRVGAATGFGDEGPKPSTETCYAVRALDAAGNLSRPSPTACAPTPDLTPPSTPSGVAAAALSPSRIALSWNASTDNVGVTGYEVRREGAVVADVPGTGAAEEGLSALREYCYSVRAHDAAGNQSPPSVRACARTPDPSLPLPPARLLAARTRADEIELRWDASPTPGVIYVVTWDGTRHAPARAAGQGRELGTTPLTRLKVFGQPARERHCYRVLARRGAQESPETLPTCAGDEAATAR
jgi:hypothetical protein